MTSAPSGIGRGLETLGLFRPFVTCTVVLCTVNKSRSSLGFDLALDSALAFRAGRRDGGSSSSLEISMTDPCAGIFAQFCIAVDLGFCLTGEATMSRGITEDTERLRRVGLALVERGERCCRDLRGDFWGSACRVGIPVACV